MSNFIVPVVLIDDIESIDGADFIELVKIGEYRSVVKKGLFKKDQKVVYIPEASILPDNIIQALGLTGKLHGAEKNRVKAIKLKSTLSQGLVMLAKDDWNIGDDVQEELGIFKWEPPIPESFRGKVCNANQEYTMIYDIENYKYFPDLIEENEPVCILEKIHGSACFFTILPEGLTISKEIHETNILEPGGYNEETGVYKKPVKEKIYKETVQLDCYAASKGLSRMGHVFDVESNKDNAYIKAALNNDIFKKMKLSSLIKKHMEEYELANGIKAPFHILGEIFGKNIQDLGYSTDNEIHFRAFDAYIGTRTNGRFLNDDELEELLNEIDIQRVPVLYKGPFTKEKLQELTNGKETVSGKSLHIREGVVVRPLIERKASGHISKTKNFDRGLKFEGIFDRVQLKNVSADYLTRKNGTEYT